MLTKIKSSATDYLKKAAVEFAVDKAKKKFIGTPTEAVMSINTHAKQANKDTNSILDGYWPTIEKKVLELVGKGLADDESVGVALKTAYSIMPMPVRLLLSEEKFVKFGMERKASFLGASGAEKASAVDVVALQSNTTTTTSKLTSAIPRGVLSARKNHGLYENLIPELLAFCVVSNGVIQDSEIKMAVSIINSDEIIRNKKKAIENFSTYIKLNMSNKRNAEDLYDLNFSTLKAKIAKLESSTEKARVDMIIESMLNSVEEITVANSRATADAMRGALV